MMPPAIADGASRDLDPLLDQLDARRIVVVTGDRAFHVSGAAERLADAFAGRDVKMIRGVEENPQLEALEEAVAELDGFVFDAVVAVGGGSVIDTAKLIALVRSSSLSVREAVEDPGTIGGVAPVVAIPTTAGSGAEMTHFAALYVEGKKWSVANPGMRPVAALVDPELTASMPPRLTAGVGLDVLAHAIESWWSTRSTIESRRLSRRAFEVVWRSLPLAVTEPDPSVRREMAGAANVAGAAIDIARTTVCHALSYAMTTGYGIPHGHAAALTLGPALEFNAAASADQVLDPRGADHVAATIAEIAEVMGVRTAEEGHRALDDFISRLGLPNRLGELGVGEEAVLALAAEVDPVRLANNPRRASSVDLLALVRAAV